MLNRRQIFQWLAALPLATRMAKSKPKQIEIAHDGYYQATWTVRLDCELEEAGEIAEAMAQRGNELLVNRHGHLSKFSKYLFETRDSSGSILSKTAIVLVGRFPQYIFLNNLTGEDKAILAEHLKAQIGLPSLFRYNPWSGTLRNGVDFTKDFPNPSLDMTWCLRWDYKDFELAERIMGKVDYRKSIGDRCVFQRSTAAGSYLPHYESFLQAPVKIGDFVSAMTRVDRIAMFAAL